MDEKLDYLMAAFDLHLSRGLAPEKAWKLALEDYVAVYQAEGDGTPLQRAASRALWHMRDGELVAGQPE